jgi:hypothetical protein
MCYNPLMLLNDNEVLLAKFSVENGPYRGATFNSFTDADLTTTDRARAILGGRFLEYLGRHFDGWRLLRRVELKSRYPGGPVWKDVFYVLVLGSDADVETVTSRIAKADYAFDFRYVRVPWLRGP